MSDTPSADDRTREYVKLLSQCERRLYSYILSLVPNFNDADDIAQKTRLRLWEEFDRYERGRDFGAWACTVAYYEYLTWRGKQSRDRLQFSQEFVEAVANEVAEHASEHDRRQELLAECYSELDGDERNLLSLIYGTSNTIKQIAAEHGRSLDAAYQSIWRLRRRLRKCIDRKMTEEDAQ